MEPWERLAAAFALTADFDKVRRELRNIWYNNRLTLEQLYGKAIFNVPLRLSAITSFALPPNVTRKRIPVDKLKDIVKEAWYWPSATSQKFDSYLLESIYLGLVRKDGNEIVPMLPGGGLEVAYEMAKRVDSCFMLAPGKMALMTIPIYYTVSRGLITKNEILEPSEEGSTAVLHKIESKVGKKDYKEYTEKTLRKLIDAKVCEELGKDEFIVSRFLLHKVSTWKGCDAERAKRDLEKKLEDTPRVKEIIEYAMRKRGISPSDLKDYMSQDDAEAVLNILSKTGLMVPTAFNKYYPVWLLPTTEILDAIHRPTYVELLRICEEYLSLLDKELVRNIIAKLVRDLKNGIDIEAEVDKPERYKLYEFFIRLKDHGLVQIDGPIVKAKEESVRLLDVFMTSWLMGDLMTGPIEYILKYKLNKYKRSYQQ